MKAENKDKFQSGAVRSLVALHGREMHNFIKTWQRAVEIKLEIPPTEDPDCETLHNMMHHVVRASYGYITWICDRLKLTDPKLKPPTETMQSKVEVSAYLNLLLDVWSTALLSVTEKEMYLEFKTNWDVTYCVDAMLEHAVMHPVRHSFQLEKLMRVG